jgi:SAM-dependent methyltransferase
VDRAQSAPLQTVPLQTGSLPTFETPRHVERLDQCFFYHTMELPEVGVVRGEWDLRGRFDEYVGGCEVRGRSVLDVGAASGFLSFEAESRGAMVCSLDLRDARSQHVVPFRDKLYFQDVERWRALQDREIERWKNAYWLAHRLVGSRARVFYGDVCDLPPGLGRFDVVIVGSVLEHLRDPVSALASIARRVGSELVLVTPLLETEDRIARFVPSADRPDLDYTWWVYSVGTYREILSILGFGIDRISSASYRCHLDETDQLRHTIVASPRS